MSRVSALWSFHPNTSQADTWLHGSANDHRHPRSEDGGWAGFLPGLSDPNLGAHLTCHLLSHMYTHHVSLPILTREMRRALAFLQERRIFLRKLPGTQCFCRACEAVASLLKYENFHLQRGLAALGQKEMKSATSTLYGTDDTSSPKGRGKSLCKLHRDGATGVRTGHGFHVGGAHSLSAAESPQTKVLLWGTLLRCQQGQSVPRTACSPSTQSSWG